MEEVKTLQESKAENDEHHRSSKKRENNEVPKLNLYVRAQQEEELESSTSRH